VSFTQGHLLCPSDDYPTHDAALVNLTTGLIDANVTTLVKCEFGAWIPAATSVALVVQAADAHLYIYDYSLTVQHTVDMGMGTIGVAPVSSDYVNTYYVAQNGVSHARVKTCTTAGSVGGTTFTLTPPTIGGMCVNPAATILYYADGANGGNLLTWNLSGNVAGPTFYAGSGTNLWGASAICLPNGARTGDVLFPFGPTGVSSTQVLRFTPAGVLAQTYTLPANLGGLDVHLSIDPQYPNTFWTRTFPVSVNTTVYTQWSLNGTIIQSFPFTTTGSATTMPTSCPMFGWSQVLSPPPSNGPFAPNGPQNAPFIGTRQTLKIRRERTAPLPILPGNARQTLSRLEIQLQPGTGTPGSPTADPKFFAQVSWNNGKTWSNERLMSAGREGAYLTRAFLNGLGAGRYPVVRVLTTDTFVPVLTDGFAWVTAGTH
jgi:uncharacterized protein YqgC (DUF456 family)